MRLPVVFVFSHDTVVWAKMGQPISLSSTSHLRAIPGLSVWRPANTQKLCVLGVR